MVLRPDDVVEYSRDRYGQPPSVAVWTSSPFASSGLTPDEKNLLDGLPVMEGRVLILGVGGGREAIALARAGLFVTGVDFVPAMVEFAKANAQAAGVRLEGLVQEVSKLDVPPSSYDVVWISARMYSCVPTRIRRIAMLDRIHRALKPGGHFLCQFHWSGDEHLGRLRERIKRAFALLTLGNLAYEPGDMLWAGVEFLHGFRSEGELRSEFAAGGFETVMLRVGDGNPCGAAILKRAGAILASAQEGTRTRE